MRKILGAAIAAMAVCTGLMTPLAAGIFCGGHCSGPCSTCRPAPCGSCHRNPCGCQPVSQPPIVIPQTVMQQRTIMQPQQITVPQTTYRDVVRTEFRTQAELQSTPVTRFKTVAVDEGAFQQVWVSRVVQKQVPETVLEQRTVYKQVPYQVTQRVPETVYTTQMQMVPRVVSQPVQINSACNPYGNGVIGAPAVSWNSYPTSMIGSSSLSPIATYQSSYPPSDRPMIGSIPSYSTPSYSSPTYSTPTYSIGSNPVSLGRELQPLHSASTYPIDGSLNPVPDPRFLDTPHGHSSDRSPSALRPVEPVRTSSRSGMFVPVPPGRSATRIR